MPKARDLFEAPIDTGDPDWFDPAKRRKIERGEHPYAKHPAMAQPAQGGRGTHAELLAGEGYREVVRKVARYTGINARQLRELGMIGMGQLAGMMFMGLQRIAHLEHGHEEELEQAAVNILLGLDEFSSAKEAVEAGELRIKAELTSEIDLEGAQLDAEDTSDKEELQIAQVAQELDLEVSKRQFINMLIQGNAMTKAYAFHLAQDLLDRIDPDLMRLYGTVLSVGEFGQYVMPEAGQREAMGGGGDGQAGGAARIEQDEDGVPVIHVQGNSFPMLLHELAKGLMEYLSYSEDEDPETRRHVYGQADTLSDEPMALMLGPGAWKRITALIPADKQKMIPYVYNRLASLPTTEFHDFMREIQAGSQRARQAVAEIIAEIEQEGTESLASDIVRRALDG